MFVMFQLPGQNEMNNVIADLSSFEDLLCVRSAFFERFRQEAFFFVLKRQFYLYCDDINY